MALFHQPGRCAEVAAVSAKSPAQVQQKLFCGECSCTIIMPSPFRVRECVYLLDPGWTIVSNVSIFQFVGTTRNIWCNLPPFSTGYLNGDFPFGWFQTSSFRRASLARVTIQEKYTDSCPHVSDTRQPVHNTRSLQMSHLETYLGKSGFASPSCPDFPGP